MRSSGQLIRGIEPGLLGPQLLPPSFPGAGGVEGPGLWSGRCPLEATTCGTGSLVAGGRMGLKQMLRLLGPCFSAHFLVGPLC